MKTKKIIACKLQFKPQTDGTVKPLYLITDETGAKIWAPKDSFDPTFSLVSYLPCKKGDKFTTKDGAENTYDHDFNQYQGGAHYNKLDMLEKIKELNLSNALTI